ncbi:type II toxin-antitoxin system VapC family toxin [Enterovirga sp. DB1703]|uniref:Ribonuclease VapC n=1 Tax=Enterovirga aerilata TaxID=2730920 RepID=A0A849I8I9_9HYPH|nr:type II toxin-antitoxin system VapC family toxin [Enterovirga sp. DB1703]NNM74104.1 type II toxin-antitoxin system VapC family toxin [Enterovirga sp. DB1703]
MSLVVDASVAVKWFVREEHSDRARELAESGAHLIAPRLIQLEVANALRRKVRDRVMAAEQALGRMAVLASYLDRLVDEQDVLTAAFMRAAALDHPIYDLIYLETARRYDAVMVTADQRLVQKLDGLGDGRLVRQLDRWEASRP